MDTKKAKTNHLLKSKGLRRTSARLDVLSIFLKEEKALSKNDIEDQLEEMDRITLYRTLKSFEDKGIIHEAIDGTSPIKYALCEEACNHREHQHNHAHFHCNACGITFCVDQVQPPKVQSVNGLQIHDIQMVLKGLCDKCSS